MKALILTDNPFALGVAVELQHAYGGIDVCQSPSGGLPGVARLHVRRQLGEILEAYDLVISIHCKQLFPAELVRSVRCVNVHPGLNPFNRGWYPQVFSILNGLKAGVTIHEMDEQLDHGPIIVQQEYVIEPWDTSGSAYAALMRLERDLVLAHYPAIRAGSYRAVEPAGEGNLNLKKDFEELRLLDLEQQGSFRELLNRLRALTHDGFRNAYFLDGSGRKIYVRVTLEPEALDGDGRDGTPANDEGGRALGS